MGEAARGLGRRGPRGQGGEGGRAERTETARAERGRDVRRSTHVVTRVPAAGALGGDGGLPGGGLGRRRPVRLIGHTVTQSSSGRDRAQQRARSCPTVFRSRVRRTWIVRQARGLTTNPVASSTSRETPLVDA